MLRSCRRATPTRTAAAAKSRGALTTSSAQSSPRSDSRSGTSALGRLSRSPRPGRAWRSTQSTNSSAWSADAEHSTVGIVLASVSLLVMPFLSYAQRRTGRETRFSDGGCRLQADTVVHLPVGRSTRRAGPQQSVRMVVGRSDRRHGHRRRRSQRGPRRVEGRRLLHVDSELIGYARAAARRLGRLDPVRQSLLLEAWPGNASTIERVLGPVRADTDQPRHDSADADPTHP